MERVGVTMGMMQWFRVPQHSPPPLHRTIGVRGGWSTASRLRFRKNGWAAGERVRRCSTTPPGMNPIMVKVDVVRADIPALLGMNLLDKESLTPCTISNRLIHRIEVKQDGDRSMFVEK